ncbi:transcription initiation factor IIE subunit beta [Nasonia vitripennis]|uniref:Transcription initiation factor IIE subunit beta n=1 Tax=Nasonia vitripennis TaxID=7425 RepID=A0A7M7IT96_NASVI|nr:transcription initiation factor IIE subunit beta [Nasonia vitripennis]
MDPALLREHEAFKRRAATQPTVEKKKREPEKEVVRDESKKKPKTSSGSSGPKLDSSNYKTMSAGSQVRFGILTKIVQHMKARHQDGEDHPLTLDEILDETNQLDIGTRNKQWLLMEALPTNPKIDTNNEGKFTFKAQYKIKDKKSLLRLLKQHDLKGLGGILLEDIQESLPHSERHLKHLANELLYITRAQDKKKIVFYNDKTAQFPVDEEFQKLWRAVAVDAMDDAKIDEYLEKQGIRSMQDHGPKKTAPLKRKKPNNKRKQLKKPRDNEHLADVLETYDDNK